MMLMLLSRVMKQRSTTPVSRRFATKSILVAASILMAVAAPLSLMPRVKADKYDDQIAALQQQAAAYQAQANQLNTQANTLANKLQELGAQKAAVEVQIQVGQAQYDKLTAQIAETEIKIKNNQDALGAIIANLYVDGTISPLEMLASSKNIGDYVDKQTYQSSIQDQLTATISTIKNLKKKLETDKVSVKEVLDKQTAQRNSLAAIAAQQQTLLDQTRGQEAAYTNLVASTKQQMATIHAQQKEALARITNNGAYNSGAVGAFEFRNFSGNKGCSGGYPYCGGKDTMVDPWGLYNQECVSFSAWRAVKMGKTVGYFSGRGNAYEWPQTATNQMNAIIESTPHVGDVAILPSTPGFAPIGHSMNIEAILGDGWLRVSQFNFGGTGEFSTMDIKTSGVVVLHFPN